MKKSLLLSLLALLLHGCAAGGGGGAAYTPPTLTINTIPPGADVSVQGNYVGQSPIAVPMPIARLDMGAYYKNVVGRVDQPLQIQVQLAGYQTKDVALGEFHAGTSQIVQPLFSASAVNTTTPGYYTLPSQVTIKLALAP